MLDGLNKTINVKKKKKTINVELLEYWLACNAMVYTPPINVISKRLV